MRNIFEEQLSELKNSLIEMGSFIEHSIMTATKALIEQDAALAKEVIEFDDKINHKEKEIEGMCLKLLLRQQPVARDLRLISSALKMITDMERIGDQSADISEITIMLAGKENIKKMDHIPKMAEATVKMVKDSIDAYVKKDLDLAHKVIEYDDVVDELFVQVQKDLIEFIHKNPGRGEQAIDLIIIAKYFERIGDHAENIAEWVVFSITGKHV